MITVQLLFLMLVRREVEGEVLLFVVVFHVFNAIPALYFLCAFFLFFGLTLMLPVV